MGGVWRTRCKVERGSGADAPGGSAPALLVRAHFWARARAFGGGRAGGGGREKMRTREAIEYLPLIFGNE